MAEEEKEKSKESIQEGENEGIKIKYQTTAFATIIKEVTGHVHKAEGEVAQVVRNKVIYTDKEGQQHDLISLLVEYETRESDSSVYLHTWEYDTHHDTLEHRCQCNKTNTKLACEPEDARDVYTIDLKMFFFAGKAPAEEELGTSNCQFKNERELIGFFAPDRVRRNVLGVVEEYKDYGEHGWKDAGRFQITVEQEKELDDRVPQLVQLVLALDVQKFLVVRRRVDRAFSDFFLD